MEDSTRTKVALLKPVLLKAGIPLAISVAGLICARMLKFQKRSNLKDLTEFKDKDNCSCEDTHAEQATDRLVPETQSINEFKLEFELRFARFCDLKNQEMVLLKIENCLMLEMARVELLDRELLLLEAENKRFEGMVTQFLKLLEQLQFFKSENGLLQTKISRILRKAKRRSRVMCDKDLQIEECKAEIVQNREELDRRVDRINVLESKVMELEISTEELKEEMNGLLNKLDIAEKSASSRIEEESMMLEDYNRLVIKFEQLQRDRAAEANEIIYLRWCNACLRHELMRKNHQQEDKEEEKTNQHQQPNFEGSEKEVSEHEFESYTSDREDSKLGCINCGNSKRPRLIEKFKKWVERRDKVKRKGDGA